MQEKTNTTKLLVFVFLVGLLSLTFLVFNVKQVSAASVQPTSSSTSNWTTTTIQLNWTKGAGGDEMFFAVASSTDNITFQFATTTIPSTTLSYTFTGLATNTRYYFLVAAVSSTNQATSTAATSTETYTLANIPDIPTIGTATITTLPITINATGNPVVSTTYAIYNTTTLNYLDAAGASTASPVWQNTSTWGASFAAIGLATNTLYQFAVIARNGANTTTVTSTQSAAKYTLAAQPNTPNTNTTTITAVSITINETGNSAGTTYTIFNTSTGNFLDAAGASTSSPVWQTTSTWGAGFAATGLATNTVYGFVITARNGDNTLAVTSTQSVARYTLAAQPNAMTIGTPTTSTLPITINVTGNSAGTTYSLYNTTSLNYLDSAGATTSTPVWQTTSTWGSSFAVTGLSINAVYQFVVVARNGSNTTTATSTASAAKYTLVDVPTSTTVTGGANGLTFSWVASNATAFYAEDTTAGSNSTWITGTSFSPGSLSCGTTHSFRVKARNGDSTETAFADAVSGSTNSCGSGIAVNVGSGGGASVTPAVPATPAVPGVSPAVPATPASVSLPSTASPVAVFVKTLGVGSKGAEVKQLQQTLRELGFFKHPTNTGLFGPATRAAVVAFQKAQGFKTAPGTVGPATRAALNAGTGVSADESAPPVPAPTTVGEFVSNLKLGSRGEEVRMLQAKLRELGFFNHPTDTGLFGGVTRAAVVAFQKDQGFATAPGVVGPATRAALNNL